jgi:hypothetical protein
MVNSEIAGFGNTLKVRLKIVEIPVNALLGGLKVQLPPWKNGRK